jgi:hypothetical protein
MISKLVHIKEELKERVHLNSVLREHQLTVVLHSQLFQTEKSQVTEDQVQCCIVSIGSAGVSLKQYIVEYLDRVCVKDYVYLEEFLVPDAAIEDLLNEHFLIGIFVL